MVTLKEALPAITRAGGAKYPMVLPGHSAFHTPLMADMQGALEAAAPASFSPPLVPLFDGSGRQWPSGDSCDVEALREYTIREQVLSTFDFDRSLEVAINTLDPDVLVLLGPGASLGGAIGQTIVRMRWRGINSKASFTGIQASDHPVLLVTGQDYVA